MTDPLHLPKNKKSAQGISIYCGQCRSIIGKTCKENNKSLAACKHIDRHRYKIVLYANAKERRTKLLETRDYDSAVVQAIEFKKEIHAEQEKNLSEAIKIILPQKIIEQKQQNKQLTELMAQYIGFLNGDEAIVPSFRRRVRSKKHIQDTARTFRYMAIALQQSGYPVHSIAIDEVSEKMIGAFHDFLLKEKNLSNRSYNKSFTILGSFYTYLIGEGYAIRNPFKTIPKRATASHSISILHDEYERLKQIIKKPELGIATLRTGERKNYYAAWLGDCFDLALFSGRRNFEISRMKFSSVVEDEKGMPSYIQIEDYKINRQRGLEDGDENKKYIYVPVTNELQDLLLKLGYESYKGTERYLIAGDETIQRDTVKLLMTRAFKHYYKQIGSRELSFKCFRKTYISQLSAMIGIDNARLITKHSGTQVMSDHYIDHKYIALTAKNFRSFDKRNERGKESEHLRENKDLPSIER
jgi:integrase